MLIRFITWGRTFAAALACAGVLSRGSFAADSVITADAYAPFPQPTAGSRQMIVTSIVPATYSVVQVQGAQPGQSTIPTPSSQPQPTAPSQGAQPGQSTIPSPTSTPPGTTPAPGAPGQPGAPGTAPAQQAPPAGFDAPFRRPSAVIVPGVQGVPQVVVPPAQVVLPPQAINVPQQPINVLPGQTVEPQVDAGPMLPPSPSPFLDEVEDLPVLEEQNGEIVERRGVRPYGGGHPTDWPWGCNGSPYRTGPGMCDDWRVGCRWHVTMDGIVLQRDETDLAALQAGILARDAEGLMSGTTPLVPTFEQFDYDPGARITFTSQVAKYTDWDVQVVLESVPEWHSSIVYPILPIDPPPLPPPGTPPSDPLFPTPIERGMEQRRFHYTSTLNSAELNFLRGKNPEWRPVFGVRYIRFDDEINDFYDQEAPPFFPAQLGTSVTTTTTIDPGPPPVTTTTVDNPDLQIVAFTDRLNLYDIQNNLIGFQLGLLHDTWQVNRRFAIEGYVNGGVYHNRVKYTNLKGTFATQFIADNVDTTTFDESRVDFSDTVINDVREYNEISYVGEASLTGLLRLNKCWALRGGYQVLYIANIHQANDAYLGNENIARDLLFHGWHAGIECRR